MSEIDARELHPQIPIVQPLITYDLNRDGLSEVILGGVNRVHWNQGKGSFKRGPLLKHWPGEIGEAAVMADFNGDQHVDFLCVTARDLAPVLFTGNAKGEFLFAGRKAADIQLKNPSAITAGDIDQDGDLDLMVVSAFAGLDLYENDGRGQFRDVRADWVNERHSFGMAHTLDDFNLDGHLDLYVIGMSSTTAPRLDGMNATREDVAEHARLRGVMGYGNRL